MIRRKRDFVSHAETLTGFSDQILLVQTTHRCIFPNATLVSRTVHFLKILAPKEVVKFPHCALPRFYTNLEVWLFTNLHELAHKQSWSLLTSSLRTNILHYSVGWTWSRTVMKRSFLFPHYTLLAFYITRQAFSFINLRELSHKPSWNKIALFPHCALLTFYFN